MRNVTPASRQLLNITKAALDHAEAELVTQRNAVIEECARVADKMEISTINGHYTALEIARRIRALKDKM